MISQLRIKNQEAETHHKGQGIFPGFSKYIGKFESLYGFGDFNSLYIFL